eukprot:gene5000-44244_t
MDTIPAGGLYFCRFGVLKYCRVNCENFGNGPSKGFGFVEYESPESAVHVLQSAPHTLDNRKIT